MRYPFNRRLHLKIHPFCKKHSFYIALNPITTVQNHAEGRNVFQVVKWNFPSHQDILQNQIAWEVEKKPNLGMMGDGRQGCANRIACKRLKAGAELKSNLGSTHEDRTACPARVATATDETDATVLELFPQQQLNITSQSQLSVEAKIKTEADKRKPIFQQRDYVNELLELKKVHNILRADQLQLAKEIESRSFGLTQTISRHKKALEQLEILEELIQIMDDDTLKQTKTKCGTSPLKEQQVVRTAEVNTSCCKAEEQRSPGGYARTSDQLLLFSTAYVAVQKYAYRWLIKAGIRKPDDNMAFMQTKIPTFNPTTYVTQQKMLQKSPSSIISAPPPLASNIEVSHNLLEHPSLVSVATTRRKTLSEEGATAKRRDGSSVSRGKGKESSREDETKASEKDYKSTKQGNKRKKRKSTQSAASDGSGKKKRKSPRGSKKKSTEESSTGHATNLDNKMVDNESARKSKGKKPEGAAQKEVRKSSKVEEKRGTNDSTKSGDRRDTNDSVRSADTGASVLPKYLSGGKKRRSNEKTRAKEHTRSEFSILEEYWGVPLRHSIAETPLHNLSSLSVVLDELIEAEKQKQTVAPSKSFYKKQLKQKKSEEMSDLQKLLQLLKECEECEKQQKDAEYEAFKQAELKQKEYCDLMRKAAGLPDCLPDDDECSTNEYYC